MKTKEKIGKDLKDLLNEDYKKGMAESHLTSWFSRYKGGKSKEEIKYDLSINHDDSGEIENTENELGRKLNDKEIDYLVDIFHKAIIKNIKFVRNVAVGYFDTLDELNLD